MKIFFLAIIFGLVISIPSFGQSSDAKGKDVGKLSGLVLDEVEARVVKAKIVIEGQNFKRVVKSDDEGYFEIWLPKGKYKIGIPEENGFYASAGKRISITPNKPYTHNFVLKGIRQDVNHP